MPTRRRENVRFGSHQIARRNALLALIQILVVGFACLAPASLRAQGLQGSPSSSGAGAGSSAVNAERLNLGKFLGAATTPVGLIIAGAIAISFFEQKRIDASARLRTLTAEMREQNCSTDRRKHIREQLGIYRSRLKHVRHGAKLVTSSILLFVITNLGASLGLIWPKFKPFEFAVLAGMLGGMLTLGAAFVTELLDTSNRQDETNNELADTDATHLQKTGPDERTNIRAIGL